MLKFDDLVSLLDSHSDPSFDDVVCFVKHLEDDDIVARVGDRYLVLFDGPRAVVGFPYGNAWRNLQIDRQLGFAVLSTPLYDRDGLKFAGSTESHSGSAGALRDILLVAKDARRSRGLSDAFTSVPPALLRRYRAGTQAAEVLCEHYSDGTWRVVDHGMSSWYRQELSAARLDPRIRDGALPPAATRVPAVSPGATEDMHDLVGPWLPEIEKKNTKRCSTCTGSLRADGETGSCEHNPNAWKSEHEPPWADCRFYRVRKVVTPPIPVADVWLVNAVRAVRALEAVFGPYHCLLRRQADLDGYRDLVVEWLFGPGLIAAHDGDGSKLRALNEALAKRGVE